MYGKKEGKFNTGKGTKNIRKELDPSKFGLKKEKPKSLYSDERGRKIIQCVSIRGALYSSGNTKYSIVDKVNAVLKELNRLHINLAYSPVHDIYDYYEEVKAKRIYREKVTFYYLVDESRVTEVKIQLDKYIKYLETVELNMDSNK